LDGEKSWEGYRGGFYRGLCGFWCVLWWYIVVTLWWIAWWIVVFCVVFFGAEKHANFLDLFLRASRFGNAVRVSASGQVMKGHSTN
jgi:hypothetical protein